MSVSVVARPRENTPIARVHLRSRTLGHSPVLDGLRGIAILLVLLAHTSVLPNGYVGVDLFFALSGFLITTLLYEEWDRVGTISLTRFYKRRARRLLPALGVLMVIALIINFAVYSMTGWAFGWKVLTSMLFVNNWVAATGHAKDLGALNPTWSLAQEEQFYLVWPLLLLLMLRRRMRPELVALFLVAAIIALVAISPGGHNYQVYYSPFNRAAELLFGCLGSVLWRHHMIARAAEWLRSLGLALPRLTDFHSSTVTLWRTATVWLAALASCVLIYLFVKLLFNQQMTTEQIYLRACLIAVPLIVMLLSAPRGLMARLIAIAPLRYLGRISYSLYLYHLLMRNVVYNYLPNGSVDLNAVLTIGLSVALAAASWKLLESRVLALPMRSHARRVRAGAARESASSPNEGRSNPARPSGARQGAHARPHAQPAVLAERALA